MSAAGESRLCIVIATCAGGQRIAALDAEVDALQRQALALDAEPTADFARWVLLGVKIDQCPHSAEGDMRVECALDSGQFQAAILTGCWAWRSSYCAGLR
jgi:hypothetical protein